MAPPPPPTTDPVRLLKALGSMGAPISPLTSGSARTGPSVGQPLYGPSTAQVPFLPGGVPPAALSYDSHGSAGGLPVTADAPRATFGLGVSTGLGGIPSPTTASVHGRDVVLPGPMSFAFAGNAINQEVARGPQNLSFGHSFHPPAPILPPPPSSPPHHLPWPASSSFDFANLANPSQQLATSSAVIPMSIDREEEGGVEDPEEPQRPASGQTTSSGRVRGSDKGPSDGEFDSGGSRTGTDGREGWRGVSSGVEGGGSRNGEEEMWAKDKEKAYRASKVPKACDVCKIRKVKCNGGEPCSSCILHDSVCQYSKVTRKSLLSRSGGVGDGTQGIGLGNKRRGIGSGTINGGGFSGFEGGVGYGAGNGGGTPSAGLQAMMGLGHNGMDIDGAGTYGTNGGMDGKDTNSRKRKSNGNASPHPPRNGPAGGRDVGVEGSGTDSSGERGQAFYSSAKSHADHGGSVPTKERMGMSSSENVHEGNTTWGMVQSSGHMQNMFGDSGQGSGPRRPTWAEPRRSSDSSGPSHPKDSANTSPRNAGTSSSGRSGQAITPEVYRSRYLDSGDCGLGPNKRRSRSPRRGSDGGGNDVRHSRLTKEEQAKVSSGSPTFSKQYGVGEAGLAADDAPLDRTDANRKTAYGASATVTGAECDVYGNAGITTFEPRADSRLQWWGPTSFVTWQDRLCQLRTAVEGDNDYQFGQKSPPHAGAHAESSSGLWRWGASKLYFRDSPKPLPQPKFDSMFLPTTLAHRFFWSYCTILHPLWPILDLEDVRQSISVSYTGGVTYIAPSGSPTSALAQQLTMARNLIVLGLGARIEGGDGDAHCPKEIAKSWAITLALRSKEILMQCGHATVSMDAAKLWLLHSLDLTNHGYADEVYITIGSAARQMLALGLHREATASLPGAPALGCRMTFWSCFVMEKFVSLWSGRPSCLNISDECDVVLPKKTNPKSEAMGAMVQLARVADKVAEMYHGRETRPTPASALRKAQDILSELHRIETSMSPRFTGFRLPVPAEERIDLDTEEGEVALLRFNLSLHFHNLRMLTCTPLLTYTAWEKLNDKSDLPDTGNAFTEIAEICVESALATVQACYIYFDKIPYLPFMGSFSNHLLYAIPILYFDILRKKISHSSTKDVESLVHAGRCLEQMDHPASEVCKSMLRDCFDNHVTMGGAPTMSFGSATERSPALEPTTWSSGLTGTHLVSQGV